MAPLEIKAQHRNGSHAPEDPLRVAVSGLGRAGWNIHIKTLAEMPSRFRVVAVTDPDVQRRDEAAETLSCKAYETYDSMMDSTDADVIVIASPSHLHAAQALAAIKADRHVVCEKPFATRVEEAEAMLKAAQKRGVVLAPFQNRRYEAHFLKVRELIDNGDLGEILQIRMCWHRFTRRWDWQAMRKFGGGALFNNGTHLLDQALALFDDKDPELFIDLRPGLSLGDADEHMKLVIRPSDGPTIDIEYTNASAFEQDRWHIMGTGGGLAGNPDKLRWKTVDWSTMPERTVDDGPAANRLYPAEDIKWVEHTWSPDKGSVDPPYELLYRDVFDAVRHDGALLVTPESAVRYLRIIERCQNAIGRAGRSQGRKEPACLRA